MVVAGSASVLYNREEGKNGSFLLGQFAPILLFRANDKVLLESELEFGLNSDGSTDTELEYAQLDYAFDDYLSFVGGKFLLPLGTFPEKLHPAWINKMPTLPLVYTGVGQMMHDTGIVPFSDIGAQALGGVHIGQRDAVFTYAGYLVNGAYDFEHSDDTGKDQFSFEKGNDYLNGSPSGGGRVAVFYPWSPYHDVEVGFSGQIGTWDKNNELSWSAMVGDAALHLGPYTEVRGEYVHTWGETPDKGTLEPEGAFAQVAYKLAGLQLDLPLISNFEAVFRYDYLDRDVTGSRTHGYALGLNYYVTNTLLLKGAYEFIDSSNAPYDHNRLTFQVAYGF